MTDTWDPDGEGVLRLPSGRLVRGRGLGRPKPAGPDPTFGLYVLGHEPPEFEWEHRWVHWRDFMLPTDREAAREAMVEVLERSAHERVEVACRGGRGRTGTTLACLAILDGVPGREAVAYVRRGYSTKAVENLRQRRFVRRFS